MTDYIQREDAIRSIADHDEFKGERWMKEAWADYLIEDAKPADVAPVRHAHWRFVSRLDEVEWLYGAVMECSQCKHEEVAHYNYCPNCGAKMDLGD